MNTQFKKGVLELCVLRLLAKRDHYGYELVSEISKKISITEGTIYPLLKRLRDEKYVETYLEESQEGPTRKYYKLTSTGKKVHKSLSNEWNSFVIEINDFLDKNE